MPRPSLKEERREQILDAYERCVARWGVEGATLEKVADEAGLARALIRHNVGNREELFDAFLERFLARSYAEIQELVDELPRKNALATLVDWMFDSESWDSHFVLVCGSLVAAAADDAALAETMRAWTAHFIGAVEDAIRRDHPKAEPRQVAAVAAGLTGIYFNTESFVSLGAMPGLEKASKDAARILVKSLAMKM